MPETTVGILGPPASSARSADAGHPLDEERLRLRRACREMEAYFLNMLLEKMHGGEAAEGLFGKSPQARMFRGMFHDAVARQMAERDALGIGEMLYQQLSRAMGTSEPPLEGEATP